MLKKETCCLTFQPKVVIEKFAGKLYDICNCMYDICDSIWVAASAMWGSVIGNL